MALLHGASARESRVSVAIYSFDVAGRPGSLQSSLTSSLLCWLSFPRPTKERPYDLLGSWAFREVFYLLSGPRGYLSPTDLICVSMYTRYIIFVVSSSRRRWAISLCPASSLHGCTSHRWAVSTRRPFPARATISAGTSRWWPARVMGAPALRESLAPLLSSLGGSPLARQQHPSASCCHNLGLPICHNRVVKHRPKDRFLYKFVFCCQMSEF
jgi:hypothetical protein